MSDISSNNSSFAPEHEGPVIEVVYPLNEETEVPNTKGQLFKTVLVEGKPNTYPPRNAKVTVHYVGTLATNGEKFDSSRDRNEPFQFTVGQNQVIRGWDQGLLTMNKGEKAILKCLPDYAYGAAGSPPKIPANSTLLFEVEMLRWTSSEDVSVDRDGSVTKSTITGGEGFETPDYESNVTFDIVATELVLEDGSDSIEMGTAGDVVLFEKKSWTVSLGVDDLPVGVLEAIMKMKRRESAVVCVAAHRVDAHKAGCAVEERAADKFIWSSEFESAIPSGKPLRYVITIVEFSNYQTINYKGMDKVNEGKKRKDEGNVFFAAGKWQKAIRKYRRALDFIANDYDLKDDAQRLEAGKLKVIVFGNLSQVYLNTNLFKDALEQANLALVEDGHNLKNLFRRAKALSGLSEWDDAEKDLARILDLDALNEPAKQDLAFVRARRAEYERKLKARYANMFAKISDEQQ